MEELSLEQNLEINHEAVRLGEMMEKLVAQKDFNELFEERFIKAFAITNTYNFIGYDVQTRNRAMEKMLGRSVFTQFVTDIIKSGNFAKQELKDIAEAQAEEAQDESESND